MTERRAVRRYLLAIIIVVICMGTGAAVTYYLLHEKQKPTIIDSQILENANFTMFYPGDAEQTADGWVLQQERTNYDKTTGVLTLHTIQNGRNRSIILTEQSLPGVFNDIPSQYSKMLTTMNEYSELQTSFGAVALTRPKELNGGQAAVISKSGTLIFAKPSVDLTDDVWRDFFESLRIHR